MKTKKITLLLTIIFCALNFINAQNFKILLVDDDNNGSSETATIETALTNSTYTWQKASSSSPSFSEMEQYDMVLWFTGNDAVTHLWDVSDTTANGANAAKYNSNLIEFADKGGIVWVDGLDFIYDVWGTPPNDFLAGDFIYDTLGISQYISQSHTADDGNLGVSQYDISLGNTVTSVDPVYWQYSTLWYADGLAISPSAHALYKMVAGTYPLGGQITALYNQVGNSTFITTGFRISKFVNQTMKDDIVSQVSFYAENNWDTEANAITPLGTQTIAVGADGTELTANETVGWDSREWKYSITSGGGYISFGTPETAKTYTPNFSAAGTYYVVCETTYGSSVSVSNEIQIDVSGIPNTCTIAPVDVQYLLTSVNGNVLTVTETPASDSREWKFSTTPGSGYNSFSPSESGLTYTPNFTNKGIYYIVCESTFGGSVVTSNEVKVIVDTIASNYYLEFDGDDSFYVKDVGENYINVTDNWTVEAWVKVASHTSGTFPVIIDRQECFSMYVQTDGAGTDDFSIAFVSRDGSDAIVSSLSSANLPAVSFNFNNWYHVAVQYDGTTAKMFINGNEVVSTADDFTLRNAGEYINIGARYRSGYERFLEGSVENVHFSDIARYSSNFTPDFYAQQSADLNSVFCLNFENGSGLSIFDASGHFSNINLRNPNNNAEWKLKKENSVTPANVQNLVQNTDGTELVVYENGLATSREWKFTTTSGSNYTSFGTPETEMAYTPNFASQGTYYVACQSVFNGTTITSNEVVIIVSEPASLAVGTINGSPFTVSTASGVSVDVPYTITGVFNAGNNFKAYLSDATGDFTNEVEIGTISSTSAGTIISEIPAGTVSGTLYRIRVKSDNPVITSADNGADLEVVNLKPDISPSETQHLQTGLNGNILTVNEPVVATSREWKYSTTSGSGYLSFATAETGATYTPNFNFKGIYYIVCESTFGTETETSNEVKIVVDTVASDYYLAFDGGDSFYAKDENLNFYSQLTNHWTIETWVKVEDYIAGTYPVIMDRDSSFTMFVQADATDNFSIAFVTRDANNNVDASISSADMPSVNFTFGEWYHVAVQYDGTITKMFINGVELVVNNTDDFDLRLVQSKYLNIGARYRASNYERYLTGAIENIHISKVAKYSSNFTPDYYSQEQADNNSILCLNFENGTGTDIFDASGNITNISLRTGTHQPSWKLKLENNVAPTDEQNIYQNEDGTMLYVNENGLATSREWKYSTTSGSGYTSFTTPETSKNYTPNFADVGTYYVVCETNFNGTSFVSNEIVINVAETLSISTGIINGSPFTFYIVKGVSVDVPYTITGIFNASNNFKAYLSDENGSFTNEVEIGSLQSAEAGTISAEIPDDTPVGTAYRIRVKSDNPEIIGSDNGVDLEVVYVGGVNDVSSSKINIYPNPAIDILNIETDKISSIKIFDNVGRIIINKNVTNNSINISNLNSGIYTIIIKTNNGIVKRSQFIKK